MRSNLKPQKKSCSTIRPLLSISRFETGKFCDFWELPIYPDLSNKKVHFLRNRVRKQLLPTLKLFFNSRIEAVLLQFAEIIEAEDHYMNQTTKKLLKKFILAKIETKKLLFTLPLRCDNCLHKVMQTQSGANILTDTSLQSHFYNQGLLAPKFVIIRCHSKKCPGDLKPFQPIDFYSYTTVYTPTYTKGPATFLPRRGRSSLLTLASQQALGLVPHPLWGKTGVTPTLTATSGPASLKVFSYASPKGGQQVNSGAGHILTLSYPFDFYPKKLAQLDLQYTIFDQFVKIIYQICEFSKLGYVGTKGQFYWSSLSSCRKSMVAVRNKFKDNQKLLGWQIHSPPEDYFCQFRSSCKKTPAFVKSPDYFRKGVSKPISTRSFLFLPSGQRQQNFFLVFKYKKERKPTVLQSSIPLIPYKFVNKIRYSGEIIACNLLFTNPTYRVIQGLKEGDKQDSFFLLPSFTNPTRRVGHKVNKSGDFSSLVPSEYISLGDIYTSTAMATSGVHGVQEKVSSIFVPVISFVKNLLNDIENNRKHASQLTLTSDVSKKVDKETIEYRKNSSQVFIPKENGKAGVSVKPTSLKSQRTSLVGTKGIVATEGGKKRRTQKGRPLIQLLRAVPLTTEGSKKVVKKMQTPGLAASFASPGGSKELSNPSGVSNEVTTHGAFQKETKCALTPKRLATHRNGDVLDSLFLFPRFSVPLGISLCMWNRKFGKSSKNSRTGIECALLGTSVKEKILSKSMILSHNNTEWKFSLDPRLTLQVGSSQGLQLQKKTIKNSHNSIQGKFGRSFFLQTPSELNVSQNQKINNIISQNLFLRFHNLENKKKNIYWPIVISFLPIAVQRRVVKLFLINQNWKKIRYSQIDNFLQIKKKPLSTFL